jgi:Holliday junction resolvase RusA-like endonuclease
VLDGLTAGGVYTDDSRVVDLHAKKRYRDVPGAEVTVTAAEVAS